MGFDKEMFAVIRGWPQGDLLDERSRDMNTIPKHHWYDTESIDSMDSWNSMEFNGFSWNFMESMDPMDPMDSIDSIKKK